MSVRVCYVRRAHRGAMLRAVRLVGQTTDEDWLPAGAGDTDDYVAAAAWIRERLDSTRSTSSLALLCLDSDGGVCSWLTTTGPDPTVVAALARSTGVDAGHATPFDFYAPTDSESTIQPLSPDAARGRARLPVLGVTDLPARLLIDALDALKVPVESTATFWHAMAAAWDPGVPRTGAGDPATDAGPLTAVIVVDPEGRLVWCWARAGQLVVGGAQRLRVARLEAAGEPADETEPLYGADDVSRLTAEWLSWAAQIGHSPRRVICVLTRSDQAGEFASGLGRAWPGATIDAAQHADPVFATLRRLADRLESTPASRAPAAGTTTALVGLSNRPGLAHRRMHLWRAMAVAGLAVGVGLVAWRLHASGTAAAESAAAWRERWIDAIKKVDPELAKPRAGVSELMLLNNEVKKREQELLPPERTDVSRAVAAELETISMVLATVPCEIERITLDSSQAPAMNVIFRNNADGEAFIAGLNRIAGGSTRDWTLQRTTLRPQPGGAESKLLYIIRGEWAEPPRPDGRSGTGGGA